MIRSLVEAWLSAKLAADVIRRLPDSIRQIEERRDLMLRTAMLHPDPLARERCVGRVDAYNMAVRILLGVM